MVWDGARDDDIEPNDQIIHRFGNAPQMPECGGSYHGRPSPGRRLITLDEGVDGWVPYKQGFLYWTNNTQNILFRLNYCLQKIALSKYLYYYSTMSHTHLFEH